MSHQSQNLFKWRHFETDIILLCVRWYLRYALSYRDLEEMMLKRGLSVDHTTIYRWVQHYAPELEKRCRPHLKACNDSWKVDETYIKVRKVWMYLYRAVDSDGNTLEFLLSPTRDAKSAKRFFIKALASTARSVSQACPVAEQVAPPTTPTDTTIITSTPRVINLEWLPKLNKERHSTLILFLLISCNTTGFYPSTLLVLMSPNILSSTNWLFAY